MVAVPLIAGIVCFYCAEPLRDQWHPLIAFNAALAAGFALSAMLLERESNQRFTAALLGCAAITFIAGWFRFREPDPLPYLQSSVHPVYWVFLGWAVLRYPLQRLQRRLERVFVTAAFGWLGLGHAAVALLYNPTWFPDRWSWSVWWPTVHVSRSVWNNFVVLEVFGDAVIAIW